MKNKVLKFIKENKMIKAGESVVLGVSGGADSMCLLHIMEQISEEIGLNLMVVHVHHGIRKETADRDAEYVMKYCEARSIACVVERVDVPSLAREWGMSEEEAGRSVRYNTFNEELKKLGGGKIAVAHNADDSAETVLLNLFRGSGIKGMSGILPVRDNVIRPVLCLTRKEIEEYNEINNVKYVDDETNFMAEYTRNKLRLNIMPAIKSDINKRAAEHINMTGQSLVQIDDYMEMQCNEVYKCAVTEYKEKPGLYIDGKAFKELHIAMQTQLAKKCLYIVARKSKDITYKHIKALTDLFDMEVGRRVNLPYGMTAIKEYKGVSVGIEKKESLLCRDITNDESKAYEIDITKNSEYDVKLTKYEGKLRVDKSEYNDSIFIENKYTKWINCDTIDDNLLLRTRRDGDYIIIDDKGSRKKIKDYFIDKKIPREERNHIWLLARGNEIIWIVGYRLSAAYKIDMNTRKIVRFEVLGGYADEGTY